MKNNILTAGLLVTGSLLATAVKANTVTFDINTLSFAYQYGLDNGGNVVSTMVDAPAIGFSEAFSLAGLTEWLQTGVIPVNNGSAYYATAQTSFARTTALGQGAFTASALAQNAFGLPLSERSSLTGFVSFWDYHDPALSDWGSNNINFSVNFDGYNRAHQSDLTYVYDWFSYSRQYVIQLEGPAGFEGVFSYDLDSLFTALENGGLASVSYYESYFRGSANCVVNVTCVTTSYDGVQYLGFGSAVYADTPATFALLAAGPLLVLTSRKRKAKR